MGTEENACNQHSLLFPKCFQNAFSVAFFKTWDCLVMSQSEKDKVIQCSVKAMILGFREI